MSCLFIVWTWHWLQLAAPVGLPLVLMLDVPEVLLGDPVWLMDDVPQTLLAALKSGWPHDNFAFVKPLLGP